MEYNAFYLNSSFDDNVHIPPQDVWDKKSTGLVTCGLIGNRRKKSNSAVVISSPISKIYQSESIIMNHDIVNVFLA